MRVAVITFLACAPWACAMPTAWALQPAATATPVIARGTVQAVFAPWDNVEGAVVSVINGARSQILVQAFTFTSRPIANALIAARRRGIDVRVTADREQSQSTETNRIGDLAAAGVRVLIESRYASAHNKVMIVDALADDSVVITGSFNWSWAAQNRNAENLLILRRNPDMSRAYSANWHRHAAEATAFVAGQQP